MSGVIDVGARDSRKMTVSERLYIPEILKGMVVTIRHLLRNLTHLRNLPTILYPERRRDYSDRFRGKHVLTTRDDGTLKCVACYMCAEACPAECITIVAGEHPKLAYEKYPVVFDIDMLRCVFCGFCVDACPKDAIWMTRDYELAFFSREEARSIPMLIGLIPLRSLKQTLFFANEVPGIVVPEAIIERMRRANERGAEHERMEGLEIARELAGAIAASATTAASGSCVHTPNPTISASTMSSATGCASAR